MELPPGAVDYFRLERRAFPTLPGEPFPADIGKNPFTGFLFLPPAFVFAPARNPVVREIILWLLGVPLSS